jgi:hypothetical protein
MMAKRLIVVGADRTGLCSHTRLTNLPSPTVTTGPEAYCLVDALGADCDNGRCLNRPELVGQGSR